MSYLDNFRTLITKPQKDHSVLSFNDTKVYPIVHFPSCPNLSHPVPEKLRFSDRIIKEGSEARIRLDHIDEEILINNDKLITNLQLDQVDMENANWEKLKTEMSAAPRLTANKKIKKDKSPLRKVKPCKSLDASPLRLNKKLTPVRLKKTNQNIKIKNINKFINKPNQRNSNQSLCQSTFSKTSLLRKPTYTHTRSTSVSTQNNKTMNRTTNKSIEKIRTKNILCFGPSSIRNHEKTFTELQNLFGSKLDNIDNKYSSLTEVDKKSLITTLLGIVYELKTEIKTIKAKNDTMKKELDTNKKQITASNKEITKLKSQIEKLNKSNNNSVKKPTYTKHKRTHSVEVLSKAI